MKNKWNEINRDHVIKAIKKFDLENPSFPPAKNTFLIHNGKKYPAKHIRGMAYEIAFGKEISKEDYTGGKETANFFCEIRF